MRWTMKRKSELLRKMCSGEVSMEQAKTEYGMSEEEFQRLRELKANNGPKALRATRIQDYRRVA